MKKLIPSLLILAALAIPNSAEAQSINSTLVVNEISFSSIAPETIDAIQFKKKKSKLLSIADFTLQPKTVFLCCTRSGYGFYFKF